MVMTLLAYASNARLKYPRYFQSAPFGGDYGPFPSKMTGRNTFRRPGFWNLDAGVYKNFELTERYGLQFRAEFYNLFNHANILGRGQDTYGDEAEPDPTFGQAAAVGSSTNALPGLADIEPPRMVQFQVRIQF